MDIIENIDNNTQARSVDNRTLLWDKLGKVFADSPRTAADAIVEAGLDWDVELRKAGVKSADGKSFRVVPGAFATVRTDTDEVLGMVKSRYRPFSNKDVFSFADSLVDGAGAAFESAWSDYAGKVIGLTMRLPDHINVGGVDPHGQYLIMKTAHDGSSSIKVATASVRMFCLNQFNGVLRNAQNSWSVHHSSRMEGKLQAAREALQISFAYQAEFEMEMEQLLATPISMERSIERVTTVLTKLNLGERVVERDSAGILHLAEFSPTIHADLKHTAYGLLQAATEYYQHYRPYRSDAARFHVNTENGLGTKVTAGLQLALAG